MWIPSGLIWMHAILNGWLGILLWRRVVTIRLLMSAVHLLSMLLSMMLSVLLPMLLSMLLSMLLIATMHWGLLHEVSGLFLLAVAMVIIPTVLCE